MFAVLILLAAAFSLYVSQLPEDAGESEVADLFSTFGEVTNVTIRQARSMDAYFAFVDFALKECGEAALAAADQEPLTLRGQQLHVEGMLGCLLLDALVHRCVLSVCLSVCG